MLMGGAVFTCPRALLVYVRALDRSARSLDAKANRLVVASFSDTRLLGTEHTLLPHKDIVLLLECPLVLCTCS